MSITVSLGLDSFDECDDHFITFRSSSDLLHTYRFCAKAKVVFGRESWTAGVDESSFVPNFAQ